MRALLTATKAARRYPRTGGRLPSLFSSLQRSTRSWGETSVRAPIKRPLRTAPEQPLMVDHCRPRMSAIRWLNLGVSFLAMSSRGRPALADPLRVYTLQDCPTRSRPKHELVTLAVHPSRVELRDSTDGRVGTAAARNAVVQSPIRGSGSASEHATAGSAFTTMLSSTQYRAWCDAELLGRCSFAIG